MLKIDRIHNDTIYLSGDKKIDYGERVLEKHLGKDGIVFVAKTNIDSIYTYGCEQTRDNYFGHKPGYIWASRASVMNAVFDVVLYEARYSCNSSYCTCAVDLVQIEDLLADFGYKVDFEPKISDDKVDVHFKLNKIRED